MVQIEAKRNSLRPELPFLEERFQAGLRQPPISNTLFGIQQPSRRSGLSTLGYTSWFLEKISTVQANCQKEQVCDHSLPHLERAAQNGLVIADMIKDTIPGTNTSLFSDPSIIFTLLVHDLGYSSPTVAWHNKHAENHHAESAHMFEEIIDRPEHEAAREFISPNKAAYLEAITGTPTSDNASHSLFPLLVTTADKLDYFRAGRLLGLPEPATYGENPYYFLASMVRDYHLHYDPLTKKLYYLVDLVRGNADVWKAQVRKEFPQVLESLENLAKATGVELSIQDASSQDDNRFAASG